MHWIKEVEMVDSVDELKSSSLVRGIRMPVFEVLDARIASALNRIIHNSHFKRRISLEEQKGPEAGPFPSRQADCLLDLRILPGHWSQWFRRELCRPILWRLWWKEVSSKTFEIRILGSEIEIMRRTPWSRIREQNSVCKEFLEIVGNGKTNGQCVKGDNCSFRHDENKRGKAMQPSSRQNRRLKATGKFFERKYSQRP